MRTFRLSKRAPRPRKSTPYQASFAEGPMVLVKLHQASVKCELNGLVPSLQVKVLPHLSYGGPRELGVSYERGTPVLGSRERDVGAHDKPAGSQAARPLQKR